MSILVTGGAGYIGSVVTDLLIEHDYKVIVLDNLSKGHKKAVHPKATFIQGDISDDPLVTKVIQNYSITSVVHFAAYIEAGESMKAPELYFENNTTKTFTFLRTLIEQKVLRFVFSSTAAVYGNPQHIPITEDQLLVPTNAYGASKLFIEQLLPWYNTLHHLNYVSLRYFNASGATKNRGEDHRNESHLIPLAMQAAFGTRPELLLYGTDYPTKDGTCIRDYIHVQDLAEAHLLALQRLESSNKSMSNVYNLGSEHGFSNLEVISTVSRVLGKQVPYKNVARRSGDPDMLIASSKKISKDLGWKPKYSNLDTIIKSAYDWRLHHPHGYED